MRLERGGNSGILWHNQKLMTMIAERKHFRPTDPYLPTTNVSLSKLVGLKGKNNASIKRAITPATQDSNDIINRRTTFNKRRSPVIKRLNTTRVNKPLPLSSQVKKEHGREALIMTTSVNSSVKNINGRWRLTQPSPSNNIRRSTGNDHQNLLITSDSSRTVSSLTQRPPPSNNIRRPTGNRHHTPPAPSDNSSAVSSLMQRLPPPNNIRRSTRNLTPQKNSDYSKVVSSRIGLVTLEYPSHVEVILKSNLSDSEIKVSPGILSPPKSILRTSSRYGKNHNEDSKDRYGFGLHWCSVGGITYT